MINNKNFWIVIIVLGLVGFISFISYIPTRFEAVSKIKMSNIPLKIGEWIGIDIPLSKRDYEILETTNLIMREYKNSKQDSVNLYIIYSPDNRKISHPPELCLTGGGLTIINKLPIQLANNLPAIKLVTEKGDYRQLVIYWFRAGNLNTDKYVKQQLKVVLGPLLGKKTSCALVRISTDIKGNDQDAALATIKSFCAQLTPLLPQYVP